MGSFSHSRMYLFISYFCLHSTVSLGNTYKSARAWTISPRPPCLDIAKLPQIVQPIVGVGRVGETLAAVDQNDDVRKIVLESIAQGVVCYMYVCVCLCTRVYACQCVIVYELRENRASNLKTIAKQWQQWCRGWVKGASISDIKRAILTNKEQKTTQYGQAGLGSKRQTIILIGYVRNNCLDRIKLRNVARIVLFLLPYSAGHMCFHYPPPDCRVYRHQYPTPTHTVQHTVYKWLTITHTHTRGTLCLPLFCCLRPDSQQVAKSGTIVHNTQRH